MKEFLEEWVDCASPNRILFNRQNKGGKEYLIVDSEEQKQIDS